MAPEWLTQLLYDLAVEVFCKRTGKRNEIPYVEAFMLLHQEEKESEDCHLMVQRSKRKPKGEPVLQGEEGENERGVPSPTNYRGATPPPRRERPGTSAHPPDPAEAGLDRGLPNGPRNSGYGRHHPSPTYHPPIWPADLHPVGQQTRLLLSGGSTDIRGSSDHLETPPPLPPPVIRLFPRLVAAGIGGGALTHNVSTSRDLEQKLQLAIEASAASITSLQHQITSVSRVDLQNRRALDLLTAGKGGTCLFLQEECCYYINETGVVEDNVDALRRLKELQRRQRQSTSPIPDWWRSTLYTWLTPILGPLILICILFMLAPFPQVSPQPYTRSLSGGGESDAPPPICLTTHRIPRCRPPLTSGPLAARLPSGAPVEQEVARDQTSPHYTKEVGM
ncbi:uncharacterized protein [Tursiops truncatus]|uniref:uncharacterized protein n=1 Tax=Tursiops truncatus TaxID=9739 RepID=UPI003CCF41D2